MKKLLVALLLAPIALFAFPGHGVAATPLLTCSNLISLAQVRSIVGDANMKFTSSLEPHKANLVGNSMMACGYETKDYLFTFKFNIWNYNTDRWISDYKGIKNVFLIPSLGSDAFRGTDSDSGATGPYFAVTTNKKYIIKSYIIVQPKSKFKPDPNKKNQIQEDVIKILDKSLDKY